MFQKKNLTLLRSTPTAPRSKQERPNKTLINNVLMHHPKSKIERLLLIAVIASNKKALRNKQRFFLHKIYICSITGTKSFGYKYWLPFFSVH